MKNIERMVISAYEDGEVESPWKEQVQRRLDEDPSWESEALLHRRVKAALAAAPEPDFSAAQARVLDRIQSRTSPAQNTSLLPWGWTSAAAAALLVLALGAGFWLGRQSLSTEPAEVAELQVDVPKQLELQLSGEGQLLMASTLEGIRR